MSDEFDRFLRNKLDSVRESDAGAQARKEKLEAEQKAEAERYAVALQDWERAREALRVLCEKVDVNLASVTSRSITRMSSRAPTRSAMSC